MWKWNYYRPSSSSNWPVWAHMAFSHLGSLWSMDLAELLCASLSAGSDRVTCVSSVVVCQSRGWGVGAGLRSCRDTESSCLWLVTASKTLIPWILQRESSKQMLGVAWPCNSASWPVGQLCPGPTRSSGWERNASASCINSLTPPMFAAWGGLQQPFPKWDSGAWKNLKRASPRPLRSQQGRMWLNRGRGFRDWKSMPANCLGLHAGRTQGRTI